MQEMLLGLVGGEQHRSRLGQRILTSRLRAEEPLKRVDVGAGAPPVFIARPLELLLHGRRHPPAVGKTELGEHRAGSRQAKVVDKILPKKPHGHGVDQECALSGKTDHASLGVQLQEFLVMQILDAHRLPPSY